MDMRIPPLKIKILLESNPLKSRILVQRSAVRVPSLPSTTREVGGSGDWGERREDGEGKRAGRVYCSSGVQVCGV